MELGSWKSGTETFPEAQMFALLAIANGMSDKEIARERGISVDGAQNIFRRLRQKWEISKRSQLVSEAIARGIIKHNAPLAVVLLMITSLFFGMFEDHEIRRTSNRLSSRSVASRTLRLRGNRSVRTRSDLISVDFEFEDMNPESLRGLFEAQANRNTLAPWSSVAGTRLSMEDQVVGSSSNQLRKEMWRYQYESIKQQERIEQQVLAEPNLKAA